MAGQGGGDAVYVICQAGHRSLMACEMLSKAGVNVVNVDGGTLAWEKAGLPIERDQKSLRITR